MTANAPVARRDIVVIGASAGGVEALRALVANLPADLPATVLVVLHVAASARSVLPAILERAGKLRAVHPSADSVLAPGTIYVAPPDHHLTLRGDRVHLSRGPRINGHRPAVDPLFRTAARSAGARVIGVILSGALDDGAAGMVSIKNAGGATLVQDPKDALYASMPRSVLDQIDVDETLSASDLGFAIGRLAGEAVTLASPEGRDVEEPMKTSPEEDLESQLLPPGEPERPASGYTCPECHGALWSVEEAKLERFRCRVGHAYTPKGLFAAQSEALEEAVWAAYRALQESAQLSRRLAKRARDQGMPLMAERYDLKHTDAQQRADLLRGMLERGRLDADDDDRDDAADGSADSERGKTA